MLSNYQAFFDGVEASRSSGARASLTSPKTCCLSASNSSCSRQSPRQVAAIPVPRPAVRQGALHAPAAASAPAGPLPPPSYIPVELFGAARCPYMEPMTQHDLGHMDIACRQCAPPSFTFIARQAGGRFSRRYLEVRLPYAQLYLYEPRAALKAQIQQNSGLQPGLLLALQNLLTEHHQYVPLYKHAFEILRTYDPENDAHIHLRLSPGLNRRRYNLPTADSFCQDGLGDVQEITYLGPLPPDPADVDDDPDNIYVPPPFVINYLKPPSVTVASRLYVMLKWLLLKDKLPMPYNKCYVAVIGNLTDIVYDKPDKRPKGNVRTVKKFVVSVSSVCFMGSAGPNQERLPNKLDSNTTTPAKTGKSFYASNRNRKGPGSATPSPAPSAPVMPIPSMVPFLPSPQAHSAVPSPSHSQPARLPVRQPHASSSSAQAQNGQHSGSSSSAGGLLKPRHYTLAQTLYPRPL
ncbi:hypothetical protein GALMADRAFT_139826 [Galerina marginata CBS 339.88]|uniref:Uncharacterized protein n=1 Tax=Galerina marginata (strain CBS 339.88) TaxID=685588 RepID=A0A067T181_GALM3|nr:hypothetical protein GALMADRAFT_139826 [Galerina marginata CBS 339.88]